MQETQHAGMVAGVAQYYQPKPEGDIDLVSEVRRVLVEAGLNQLVEANYDNNRFIVDAANKPSSVQRFLLNRFWNYQLVSCEAVSIDERYCLIPNGTVQDWLKLFTEKVLPFAIANQLPKSD
jgi:hypothetical protein